ncbi:MAG: DNA translocase FtsK [Candidatus Improbicoccus pseudotrichonymphae]|uniref:DNA translocase FtsK n=1 Tax=Candidatus Improbicoccus pseudotrichonymphae TaxID=3033792 RepID=A0AA48KYJ4_9FIRM|nr:MAG: DNA translocase FtsK [Candidatus Improbicoccus pseudotrichonymphae]
MFLNFKKNGIVKSIFLGLGAVFSFLLYFIEGENLWFYVRKIFLGMFGFGSIFVPIFIFICLTHKNSSKNKFKFKSSSLVLFVFLSVFLNVFLFLFSKRNINLDLEFLGNVFNVGRTSSGVLCAILSFVFIYVFGLELAKVLIIFLVITNIILLVFLYKANLNIDFDFIFSYFDRKSKKSIKKVNLLDFENSDTDGSESSTKKLLKTLESFGVSAKVINISRGPSVTRYELQPAPGVKLSRITSLSDNIALSLSALGVRIEAPIPGKSAVGIEIPNKVVSAVNIKELIKTDEFMNSISPLTVVLGKDISGNCIITDLSKMPHLLIAGSTGSGKSVCVNSFIASLLYKSNPQEVKLIMIDPKVVELSVYNGVPHLLVPVVTDPKKAAGALLWAVEEMLSRYKIFAEVGVRDLESYNKFVLKSKKNNTPPKMSRMLIIIDELADLMMASPKEIEDYICRLAQMARAAGMHLIIATQRPSVDIITGVIKANVPSRIALAVSSQVDSRTIIDTAGAEKLIGRGDMLFSPLGSIKPIRVQGCYIDDEEIQKMIEKVKKKYKASYDNKIIQAIENYVNCEKKLNNDKTSEECEDRMDPSFKEAAKYIIESGFASITLLNKNFGFGYKRSGKIMEELERMGVVSNYESGKTRRVLMNYKDFLTKINYE